MSERGLPDNLRIVSELSPGHDDYSVEDERVMEALVRAEAAHFWHLARNAFIASRLRRLGRPPPARVLELGCGSGCVAAALDRAGWQVTGVEGHLSRARIAAARSPRGTFLVHDLRRGLAPLGNDRWDVVGLFDVVEHLEDPAGVLRMAVERAEPGGIVVGTVPALMTLWSEVDVRSGHRVRYERAALAALLRSLQDVEVLEVAPFNRLLVPALWLQRRAVHRADALERSLEVPWGPANRLVSAVLRLEYRLAPLLDRMGVPGASLWFAVRRPSGSR